jgi:acetylornithine deacetylase
MKIESLLSKLISFKTISRQSNKELIIFIKDYLKKNNVDSTLFEGEKNQFNLYAKIGPNVNGGIIFSGHTDVVPTDGQKWKSDPFKLVKKKNKYFGRGACDMKGFIATLLSSIPEIKIENLKKPIHLIFSYDEEIGCVGIQKIIPFLKKIKPKPQFCIVGEPTEMKLINQHKGKKNFVTEFNGIESHSSLIDNGVNSIMYCMQFIEFLKKLQVKLKTEKSAQFSPPHSTINIGVINGGVAVNIVPNFCSLEFEIRDTPNLKTDKIIVTIESFLNNLEKQMKKKNNKCFINFKQTNDFPPLKTEPEKKIISFVLNKLESNSIESVSFGTEAGVFDKLGFETIVCGPGSIKQAHKADEFIEHKQLLKCKNFLLKTFEYLY